MKRAGCRCGPFNDCNVSSIGSMCETDGNGNCSEWIVGDFNLWHLTGDELQAAFEASTTKFYGTWVKENDAIKGLKLIEVGMLAEAGLTKGDILSAIIEDRDARVMENPDDHLPILTWQFVEPELRIVYQRLGSTRMGIMKNPAVSKGEL
jgi:hypothetical protein